MRILSLDLATKTGFALWDGSRIESGVQDFTKGRGESNGMLFLKFNAWLNQIALDDDEGPARVDLIAYEQPAIFRSGAANEIAVGLCTRVQEFGERNRIEYFPVPVPTLKKWSTGQGHASKELMFAAARGTVQGWSERIPPFADRGAYLQIHDDNEADAIMLLAYAMKKYEGGSCSAQTAAAVTAK